MSDCQKNPGSANRGVKKAPFIVLIGANMPSILAEISFVSNPNDEKKLRTNEYRQRIADSLYKGVSSYINGLSGDQSGGIESRSGRRACFVRGGEIKENHLHITYKAGDSPAIIIPFGAKFLRIT